MVNIVVDNFAMETVKFEGDDYVSLIIQSQKGGIFSLTLHPYQVSKLIKLRNPEPTHQTPQAISEREKALNSFALGIRRDDVKEHLLATYTNAAISGRQLTYKLTLATGGDPLSLEFDEILTEIFMRRLTDCVAKISSLTRH